MLFGSSFANIGCDLKSSTCKIQFAIIKSWISMLCLALYGSSAARQRLNYINQGSIHLSYETLASQTISSIILLLQQMAGVLTISDFHHTAQSHFQKNSCLPWMSSAIHAATEMRILSSMTASQLAEQGEIMLHKSP